MGCNFPSRFASTLTGRDILLSGGRDALLMATNVLADHDIDILAGRNLGILAADNRQTSQSHSESRSMSLGLTSNYYGRMTILGIDRSRQNEQSTAIQQSTALLSANGGNLNLTLSAGRDINVKSTTVEGQGQAGAGRYHSTRIDRVAGLYVTGQNGALIASAGRDLNLVAADVYNGLIESQPTAAGHKDIASNLLP